MAGLLASPKFFLIDGNGDPAVGWQVFTYEVGTTTPKATYTDAAAGTANTNPVILNARGEADIWWDGEYKVVIKDEDDNTIYTVDNFGHGNITLGDNDHLYIGSGNDLDAYHDATDSFLLNKTGDFTVSAQANSQLLNLKSWDSVGSEKNGIVIGGATRLDGSPAPGGSGNRCDVRAHRSMVGRAGFTRDRRRRRACRCSRLLQSYANGRCRWTHQSARCYSATAAWGG